MSPPRFPLGQIVFTPGALDALVRIGEYSVQTYLDRHVTGDWGEVGVEDVQENELSVEKGFRILSAYRTRLGTKIWVITESDRSSTCILLPEEY